MLLATVAAGACLKFVIPGKRQLSDPELDRLSDWGPWETKYIGLSSEHSFMKNPPKSFIEWWIYHWREIVWPVKKATHTYRSFYRGLGSICSATEQQLSQAMTHVLVLIVEKDAQQCLGVIWYNIPHSIPEQNSEQMWPTRAVGSSSNLYTCWVLPRLGTWPWSS